MSIDEKRFLPNQFIKYLTGKDVLVKLKWNLSYSGILIACDKRMNLHLQNVVEYCNGEQTELAEVLIRCNNILYLSEKPVNYAPNNNPDEIVNEDEIADE